MSTLRRLHRVQISTVVFFRLFEGFWLQANHSHGSIKNCFFLRSRTTVDKPCVFRLLLPCSSTGVYCATDTLWPSLLHHGPAAHRPYSSGVFLNENRVNRILRARVLRICECVSQSAC